MKTKITKTLVCALAFAVSLTCSAADYYWTGSQDNVWKNNTSYLNWTNSAGTVSGWGGSGNRAIFENANSILTTGTNPGIKIVCSPNPSEMIVNTSDNLLFNFLQANVWKTKVFAKTSRILKKGSGTLTFLRNSNWDLENEVEITDVMPKDGVIEIQEGYVDLSIDKSRAPLFTPIWKIASGGTLRVKATNSLDKAKWGINSRVILGGDLRFTSDCGDGGYDSVKELALEGGEIYMDHSGSVGGLVVCGAVIVTNETAGAQTLRTIGASGKTKMGIAIPMYYDVEFRVADVTGSDADDLIIDSSVVADNGDWSKKLSIIKTGAGTVCWTNMNWAYGGNIEIREGVYKLDRANYDNKAFAKHNSGYLGNMRSERTIMVTNGATLHLGQRNMTYYNTVNGYPKTGKDPLDKVETKFVIDGSTLKFGANAGNVFGPLIFRNATLDYTTGMDNYGLFELAGDVTVEGSTPLVLRNCSNAKGYGSLLTFCNTNLAFNVADVSASPADDLTIEWSPRRFMDKAYPAGFRKCGAGTMRLKGGSWVSDENVLDGPVKVEAGTLLVDNAQDLKGMTNETASVTVAAGAAIGGIGSTPKLTLAEGSGFAATAGQSAPFTVAGDLSLPKSGFVDLYLPDDSTVKKVAVAKVTGNMTGDVSGFTAKINGVPNADWIVTVAGDTIYIKKNVGCTLFVW